MMFRPSLPLAIFALTMPAPVLAQSGPAELPPVPPVTSCSALADVDLGGIGGEGSQVTAAEETTSNGVPVCSVTGTLAPKVNFEVLLPTESWTQRYLQVGCGGLCGQITLNSGASAGCAVLDEGGFVMAATDMGHTDQSGKWGLDDQQRADFAYRAQHVTAEATKALIRAFYGQPEEYSYFNGCSDGGREALMAAARYPDDFDGIIAGAPAMLFQVQNTLHHGWLAASNYDEDGKVIVTSDKLPLLHQAVLDACDARDGVEDGLISQPALCDFDPRSLVGKGLTEAQAETVAKFYDGPRDPETGAALTTGNAQYGSELEWQGIFVADSTDGSLFSEMIVDPVLRYLAFPEPSPDAELSDLEFTEATLDALRPRHPLFDATNSDLSAFEAAGGKLIMWHGLADPHISPANTLALHKAMQRDMGTDTVAGFERLYLLPGVAHCGGGQGPSDLDLLTPMMAWVEGGTAPRAIHTASASEGSSFGQPDGTVEGGEGAGHGHEALDLGVAPLPEMSRQVYPYPATAEYTGTGEVTEAENWQQGPDAQIVALHDSWPGEDFFSAYEFIDK